jgi:hypothetical protein
MSNNTSMRTMNPFAGGNHPNGKRTVKRDLLEVIHEMFTGVAEPGAPSSA